MHDNSMTILTPGFLIFYTELFKAVETEASIISGAGFAGFCADWPIASIAAHL
jgi:hypothetical protein